MPRVNGVYYDSQQAAYDAQQAEIQQNLLAQQAVQRQQRAAFLALSGDNAAEGFASVAGTCSVLAYQGVRFASAVGTLARHDQSAFAGVIGWLYFAPRVIPEAVAQRVDVIRRIVGVKDEDYMARRTRNGR